jgi:hypothetical protein
MLPAGPAGDIGPGGFHLAIFVPGSGSTDRDGNNYQVPGTNDSTLQLALALASRGIASFRYDKRGVGESWALAPDESRLSFDDYIEDLRAILARLAKEPGFSGIPSWATPRVPSSRPPHWPQLFRFLYCPGNVSQIS